MQFLADLNGLTIFLTITALVVSLLYLGYTWANRPTFGRGYGILLAVCVFCLMAAYDAYCPDASQTHIRLTGWVVPIRSYTYHSGKSTYSGLIACVQPCSADTPRLEFNHSASYILRHGPISPGLSVVYLGRTDEADVGGSRVMLAHPVVEVENSGTGERLFYRDTRRHWPRAIFLMVDAAIVLGVFLVCLRLCSSSADSADEGSSEQSDRSEVPDELIGLGLSAGGKDTR